MTTDATKYTRLVFWLKLTLGFSAGLLFLVIFVFSYSKKVDPSFKVVTKAGVTSADVIYTAGSGVTAIVLGLILGNTTTSQITSTVTLSSDTSSRAGANDEANQAVELITDAPIPAGSSLELLSTIMISAFLKLSIIDCIE